MASGARNGSPGKFSRSWGLILILGAFFLGSLTWGLILFFRDAPAAAPPNTSPAPYLRIYAGPKDKIPPITVSIEQGQSSGRTYVLVSFTVNRERVHKSARNGNSAGSGRSTVEPVSFTWTAALLCVPEGTEGKAGKNVASGQPVPLTQVSGCPSGDFASGNLVTGTYNSAAAPQAGPGRKNIEDETDYLAKFIIPSSYSVISSSGGDVVSTFPHVISENICHLQPQGEGAAPNLSVGPEVTSGELSTTACARIKSFTVHKTLDLSLEDQTADTVQVPEAAGFSTTNRTGFVWDDPTGNGITFVQASSPINDARFKLDEFFAGIILGASGGVLIALLQELNRAITKQGS